MLALVQYFYTLELRTALQNRPLVVTALLEIAQVYGQCLARSGIYRAQG